MKTKTLPISEEEANGSHIKRPERRGSTSAVSLVLQRYRGGNSSRGAGGGDDGRINASLPYLPLSGVEVSPTGYPS